MKISDIIRNKQITVSCELFPPKKGSELTSVKTVVSEIASYHPDFMSVTYGAGGTNQDNTLMVANEIENINHTTALAHLTCVGADDESIENTLSMLKQLNIENILALRGDIPEGCSLSEKYVHASDLINKIKSTGDFCIGGACYPEGHPESGNIESDINGIKMKVESGCEFLTTQMFFDNNILYSYIFRLLKNGIDVPVIAGIMPVTNAKQIKRICSLSNTALPPRFKAIIDKFSENPSAMKQAGIAYATEQIIDLIANGINNIHIYSMNRPDIAGSIINNLSEIIK